MRNKLLLSVIIFSLASPAIARPSMRSIREGAESYSGNGDAGWRMQFFNWEEYGLRTTYPESWQDPIIENNSARIMPHDNELGQRKNYLLELTNLVWDTGQQLEFDALKEFAKTKTPSRFNEFYWGDSEEIEVDGYPAWNIQFSTMTGK